MYNGVPTVDLPIGVVSIGFVDDIGVTDVARLLKEVELYANAAVYEIKSWLENADLQLAEHKKEVVLITKRSKCTSNFRLVAEDAATNAHNIGALVARILPIYRIYI